MYVYLKFDKMFDLNFYLTVFSSLLSMLIIYAIINRKKMCVYNSHFLSKIVLLKVTIFVLFIFQFIKHISTINRYI